MVLAFFIYEDECEFITSLTSFFLLCKFSCTVAETRERAISFDWFQKNSNNYNDDDYK